jgi:hypothetical protein
MHVCGRVAGGLQNRLRASQIQVAIDGLIAVRLTHQLMGTARTCQASHSRFGCCVATRQTLTFLSRILESAEKVTHRNDAKDNSAYYDSAKIG